MNELDIEKITQKAPLGATHYNINNKHYYQASSEKEVYIFRLGLGEWGDSIMLFRELDDKDCFLQLNFKYDIGDVVQHIDTDTSNNLELNQVCEVEKVDIHSHSVGELLYFTNGLSCFSYRVRLVKKAGDVEFVKPLSKTVDITINLCQQYKPPLGLKPEYIFRKELEDMTQQMKEARYAEVLQACLRYCDNDMVIPRAWIAELESLRKV